MEKFRLNTNEISVLWSQYKENTLFAQMLKYFANTTNDPDIKSLLEQGLELTENVARRCKAFFEQDGLPIPHGFSEDDVNLNADKLFLDQSMLLFLGHTCKSGILAHGSSLMVSARKDVREFFSQSLATVTNQFNKCVEIGLDQGIYIHPPQVEIQPYVEFVESKKYFTQAKNRPLNTIELTHLFENIRTNTLGEIICTGFAQTTKDKEIKNYIKQGMKISQKHINIFSKELEESFIHAPSGTNSYVTNSTEPVFSDKLIVTFLTMLSAVGQSNYAFAASSSMRHDLILHFQRLSVEIALYEKDGADLLVKNGWLEEPPQIPDRKKLLEE